MVICFEYVCYSVESKPKARPQYFRGDYIGLREFLERRNFVSDKSTDVESLWNTFQEKVTLAVGNFVPKTIPHKRNKNPDWMCLEVANSINVKDKHNKWNKFQKHRSITNWEVYVSRNRATSITKRAKQDFERKIAGDIKKNPNSFWNVVRKKTRVKTGISDLVTEDGVRITENRDKAQCFNSFFSSVFTREDLHVTHISTLDERQFNSPLTSISVNKDQVKELLDNLKTDKSPGPDKIHNKVLYEAREVLARPITNIFRRSPESGKVPAMWKVAEVTPIYKKGKKNDLNNYRPVSLTSCVCKILETIVRNQITLHLTELLIIKIWDKG